MASDFDPEKFGLKSRTDLGTFLLFGSLGGLADAIWNVAAYAEPLTVAPLCGVLALSLKKLVLDRDPAPPKDD